MITSWQKLLGGIDHMLGPARWNICIPLGFAKKNEVGLDVYHLYCFLCTPTMKRWWKFGHFKYY
jgi:hypothetical protein